MKHGSLFSGIGGFDLASQSMGWDNIFHCEWNPFGQKILKHYFPNSISYDDITKTDFSIHRGTIDILTGGFPCQPYSTSGLRKGKDDERHLFPEMLRAIKEIKPRWVVGENVRGLVSWNGGLVFDEVCADLESEGYEVQPFLIPAAGIGARHQRQRIWFIAYSKSIGRKIRNGKEEREIQQGLRPEALHSIPSWETLSAQSPICGEDDGLPKELDNITFSKWRSESVKAYGNAIVPQVAYQIFKTIELFEKNINQNSILQG